MTASVPAAWIHEAWCRAELDPCPTAVALGATTPTTPPEVTP